MTSNTSKKDFRQYCLQFYKELQHPYSATNFTLNINDLEVSLDILEGILGVEVGSKDFEGLEEQFYSAFDNYLHSSRTEIGTLSNNVDKLASLIDAFSKKTAYYLSPNKRITKRKQMGGTTSIFLRKTSNYADILESFEIIKVADINKTREDFWLISQQLLPY